MLAKGRHFVVRSRRVLRHLEEATATVPFFRTCPASDQFDVKPVRRASGQAPTFRTILKDQRPDRLQSAKPTDLFCDPAEKLQKLLDVSLFGHDEKPFRPTKEEMLEAQEIFTSRRPRDIRRLESTITVEEAPIYHLPEIAFMGRSNVGKSSLIKAIFHASPYLNVPTSKFPGHTKTLRFYQVKEHLTLVDMPGYGENEPTYFKDCVENFLQHRQNLVRAFLLYDSESQDVALEECAFMEKFHVPYAIVLNKIDLLNETARLNMLAQVRQIRDEYASSCCFPQPFLVSSKTGEGLAYVQAFIAHITANAGNHRTMSPPGKTVNQPTRA